MSDPDTPMINQLCQQSLGLLILDHTGLPMACVVTIVVFDELKRSRRCIA